MRTQAEDGDKHSGMLSLALITSGLDEATASLPRKTHTHMHEKGATGCVASITQNASTP